MNTITVARPASALVAHLQLLHIRWLALVALLFVSLSNMASAQGTPQALQTELDAKATTFCSYVNVLPNSKWVKLGALIFFLIGMVMMIFGGRGGNVYLLRAIGAVVLIPAAIALGKAFGIVC